MTPLLSAVELARAVDRMAYEIVERVTPAESIAFLGVRTRGVTLAGRLCRRVSEILGREIACGAIDVTLYRDDVGTRAANAEIKVTDIPFDMDDRRIVLVDDVLYTGRTVRAALDLIMDFGRPRAVALAVLVDRGGRELPIRADFTGKTIELLPERKEVVVRLAETDGEDGVHLT